MLAQRLAALNAHLAVIKGFLERGPGDPDEHRAYRSVGQRYVYSPTLPVATTALFKGNNISSDPSSNKALFLIRLK